MTGISGCRRGRGFTLIELLGGVALLVIVLGLMVSLARDVRHRSSEKLTRQVFMVLEQTARQYGTIGPMLASQVPPMIRAGESGTNEQLATQRALENSRALVQIYRKVAGDQVFRELPLSVYDETILRDAWGTPVVYMPSGAPNFGMTPQKRAFFLSAGPDRRFTTLLDNVYSYERAWEN